MLSVVSIINKKESVGFEILIDGCSKMLSEMSFNISIYSSASECQKWHFSSFEIFLLTIELVDDKEGECVGGKGERMMIWRFDSFAVKE